MKQIVKIFVPLAVAAIALFSCAKEIKAPIAEEGFSISVSTTVADLDSPATSSKTYIDTYQGTANTILWGEGERMRLGITADTTIFVSSASTSAYNGEKKATFSFTVTTPPKGSTYTYQGIYPASAAVVNSNDNPTLYKVELPAIQAATAASYDPAAYILVAYPETFATIQDNWQACFRRATALNKVTLTGINDDILSVEFTAPDDVHLAGRRYINLATGESGEIYYGGTNVLKVNYASALTAASKVVWFTSWEGVITEGKTLKIVAKSATKTYTRTLTARAAGIQFRENKLNTLNVDMSSAQVETLADYSGNYVILGIKDGKWYIMDPANTGKYYPTLATEVDADAENDDFSVLQGVANINDYVFTVATYEGAYSIKSSSTNKYVSYKGNSNEAYAADALGDSTKFAIEYNATTKAATISSVNVSGRKLVFNSGSPRFACYTSDQAGAYLMPAVIDSRTAVTLTFPNAEVNQTSQDYGDFYGLQATADPNVSEVSSAITYSWTGDDIFSDFDTDTGDLELSGTPGFATITATFAGSTNYKPAHVSYTVTVTDASKQYYTKVTSAPGDWSGEYLLVCEEAGKVLSEISTGSTKFGVGADATITAGKIESTATIDAYKVTIAPASAGSAYTMDFAGEYLYWGSGNSLNVSDTESDNSRWTITAGTTAGNWIITNVAQNTRVIWYNTGSPRFACYENKTETTTGYAPVQLYKLEDNRPVAGMSWSAASASATLNTGNVVSGFTAPTLNAGHATNVTFESTNTAVATVSAAGAITVVGPGEAIIKAIFAGDATYKPSTVSCTITVTDNRDAVATPTFNPAAGDVAANTVVTISSSTSGATIYYTVDGSEPTTSSTQGSSVTIDESKTVKAIAVKEGYKNSAVASAAYTVGGIAASGTEGNPYTVAQARAAIDANAGITGVYATGIISQIVTEFNSQYNNTSFNFSADGLTTSDQLQAYRIAASSAADYLVGDGVIVTGNLKKYNTTYEFDSGCSAYAVVHMPVIASGDENFTSSTSVSLTSSTDGATIYYTTDGSAPTASSSVYSSALNLTATTTVKAIAVKNGLASGVVSKTFNKVQAYAVTFSQPANGSIVVKHGTTTLSSGAMIPQGETITITATPADGYSLSTLVYNDGSDHDIKSTKSFVMPGHAVSITATFESGQAAEPELVYTLDGTTTGGSNGYATESDITQNSIAWKVTGNTTVSPWRVGGKGAVVRPVYSATAISADITSIAIEHGSKTCTVNSLKVTVHNSAADAASGSNAIATFTITTAIDSKTTTINKADSSSWAGKFYRFEYDLTCASGTNQYLQLKNIKFTGIK